MAEIERHTIAVLVDNEPGILARVVGLFSGRGYNIESLTVAEVDRRNNLSRITVVTSGTRMIIEQIKAQLSRLVPVHKVHDLTDEGPLVEREMALIKVAGKGESRIELLRLADIFRARVIDSTTESFVFEMTGSAEKLNAFITLMEPLGLVEVSRTGAVAIARGPRASSEFRTRETTHARLLRPRRGCEPGQVEEGRGHRLWQPGPRPRQQSARQRGQGRRRRACARARLRRRRPRTPASRS